MGLSLRFIPFMHLVSSFLLVHLTITRLASSMPPVCHDNERVALLQFKQSFIINQSASYERSAYPKFASWTPNKENSNCCLWDGVDCDEETGHVIKLDLTSSCLYGSINSSSSLFRLVHLRWLSLADNYFCHSKIPSAIIKLERLSHLDMSLSVLSGQIPWELLGLSKLVILDLTSNYLELHNPSLTNLVEKLTNLVVLSLQEVEISSPLPVTLTNLSSLTYLELGGCRLQGKIPTSLTGLTKLQVLDLSYNNFVGELPSSLSNLTQLSMLGISSYNSLGLQSSSLSWIANLKKLTFLNFASCNLIGGIPSVLMNLTQLTVLVLSKNQLSGPIPSWLMNMNSLTELYLDSNQLFGHIPVEISNLTQLQLLRVQLNQLEGSIPSSIVELKNLQQLDISFNNFGGTVDLGMFLLNLKSLSFLILSSNKLSLLVGTNVNTTSQKFQAIGFGSCNISQFPFFLHDQDRLMSLDLSSNKIAGQIPRWFLNVATNRLRYLNLSFNLLTGFEHNLHVLPFTSLATLDLRFNKLQGPLPVPSVYTISYLVSNNQLIGEIQPWICTLNDLHFLDLSYNNLSGMLPNCLGNSSSELLVLKLQGNNFDGSIPNTFTKGSKLTMIDFSKNSLQGRIPRSLANCMQLKFLNLGNNQISDLFPSWLGILPVFEVLVLKFNRFYGVLKEPKDEFEFSKLRIIDISHNRFTGNLPSKCFWSWNAMKDTNTSKLTYLHEIFSPNSTLEGSFYGSIDYSLTLSNKGTELEYQRLSNLIVAVILSNNKFVGEIPTSIANLKGLRTLNLSNNNLEGHIPSSLGDLTMLESLDLSNNSLGGEIPQQLTELTTLAVFDVSHNHLVGAIPQGRQFNTFENSSFEENLGLCGKPLSKKCENSETWQDEDPQSDSLFAFGWKIVLIGYASGTVAGLVFGHTFITRKQEWAAKTFRLQLKASERKRRLRN